MAETVIYLIERTNSDVAFAIQPRTFDGSAGVQRNTDLTLYGNATPSWGERFNENFYRLLESFAVREHSTMAGFPADEADLGSFGFGINNPIVGQKWYNTDTSELKVYNGTTWDSAGKGATIADILGLQTALDNRYTKSEADARFIRVDGGNAMAAQLTLEAGVDPTDDDHAARKSMLTTSLAELALFRLLVTRWIQPRI